MWWGNYQNTPGFGNGPGFGAGMYGGGLNYGMQMPPQWGGDPHQLGAMDNRFPGHPGYRPGIDGMQTGGVAYDPTTDPYSQQYNPEAAKRLQDAMNAPFNPQMPPGFNGDPANTPGATTPNGRPMPSYQQRYDANAKALQDPNLPDWKRQNMMQNQERLQGLMGQGGGSGGMQSMEAPPPVPHIGQNPNVRPYPMPGGFQKPGQMPQQMPPMSTQPVNGTTMGRPGWANATQGALQVASEQLQDQIRQTGQSPFGNQTSQLQQMLSNRQFVDRGAPAKPAGPGMSIGGPGGRQIAPSPGVSTQQGPGARPMGGGPMQGRGDYGNMPKRPGTGINPQRPSRM